MATAQAAFDNARQAGFEAPAPLARPVRYGAAAASLAAAAVHASAISTHTFDWVHTMAFVAMTVFQAWWAHLVLRSTARRVFLVGAIGHGAIVGLWALSRSAGIPGFLPGGHEVEAVGLKDGLATLLAVGVIAAIDVLSRREVAARPVRPSVAGTATGLLVAAIVTVGAVAVLAPGHVHGGAAGHEHVHDHGGAP